MTNKNRLMRLALTLLGRELATEAIPDMLAQGIASITLG